MADNNKKNFKSIGNLAFYDGWKPTYVYFKSLYRFFTMDNTTKRGSWDPVAVQNAAAVPYYDAMDHVRPWFNNQQRTEADSIKYFTNQFVQILNFLYQAYKYELNNEKEYFLDLKKKFNKAFKKEENASSVLTYFYNLIDGYPDNKVNYKSFITFINILQSGLKNTQAIAQYEAKHISEVNNVLDHLLDSRENQAYGLGEKFSWDTAKTQRAARKGISNYLNKVYLEYTQKGSLIGKKNNKYVLFGGQMFNTIKPAVDRVLADWSNAVMKDILDNPETVISIVHNIKANYPTDGDFKMIQDEIQEKIILAVIQYGLNNLPEVLADATNEALIAQVEQELSENSTVFDMVDRYNIKGLDTSFGRITSEAALFQKDTNTQAETLEGKATEFYAITEKFMKEVDKYEKDHSSSLFIKVLEQNKKTQNLSSLQYANDLITLINQVIKIQKELDALFKKWQRQNKKNGTFTDISKITHLGNSSLPVTIFIENGKPQVKMEELKEALKNNTYFKNIGFKTFNPSKIETAITALKARASLELKEELINAIRSYTKKKTNTMSKNDLIATIRHELSSLTVNINGPTLAELIPGIRISNFSDKIRIDWNRYKGKNDMVTVTIKYNDILRKIEQRIAPAWDKHTQEEYIHLKNIVEKKQLDVLESIQEVVHKSADELTKTDDIDKYSKMIDTVLYEENHMNQISEEVAKRRRALRRAANQLQDFLKEQKVSNKNFDDQDRFLEDLSKSFQVSYTVKSANTYLNHFGFKGGKLGNQANTQLARIADIFKTAGMPISKEDYDWLQFSILNCFPDSLIGDTNKNLIENYLGSLVAFALFDEGGAESALISKYYKTYFNNLKKEKTTSKILHLYVVNGIYVPGSYVLLKVMETLKKEVIPNIEQIPATMNRGAGITIINNMSEKDIPNRPLYAHQKNPDTHAWATVGQIANKQVSIKILFLAGLLDIVNDINNAIGRLQLPN